jgi:hypothetical protein
MFVGIVCLVQQMTPVGTTADAALGSNFTQQARLSTDIAGDEYPGVVGISGDTAVASSTAGVHVYLRAGATWSQQALLIPSDGPCANSFGTALAIDGDTMVIGCEFQTVNGNSNQGAAYVFVRNGTAWMEQQKLTGINGSSGDRMGNAVSISGDTIIVGARARTVAGHIQQGSAYIFVRSGTVWTEQARLDGPDGDVNFGRRVAISGNTAAITRARSTIDPAVYIFVRSGTVWQQQQMLSICEASANGLCDFGSGIGLDNDTVAVGNDFLNVGANLAQGGVYIFTRSGTTWSQQQRLTASDGQSDDNFAGSVDVQADTVVVGASASNVRPGSAYVFTRSAGTWTENQKLQFVGQQDAFGSAVALDTNSTIIARPRDGGDPGAFIGAAYVYINSNATPTPTPTPTATPTPTPTPTPPAVPTIFVEEGTTNVLAAVDSVTLVRGPFTLTDDHNFSSDHRTRVIFFTTNLGFTQPTQTDIATLSVEVGGFSLAAEGVGPSSFTGFDASYIVFRLPDLPLGDWPLTIHLRGVASANSPTITIRAGP